MTVQNKDIQKINQFLIDTFNEKEQIANEEVEAVREALSALQISFDQREKEHIKESTMYSENVLELHDLLEKAAERLEEGWDPVKSVSEAYREQIEALEQQLDAKDRDNEKLQSNVTKAQNQQRKDISDTIAKFKKYLTHMSEIEQQTESKYQNFLTEQIENDKTNASREKSDADMVNSLNSEVNSLRFKIRELEANNKEKEYAELKTELVKTKSDLDHAKQNLVNYIHSFTTLESQVKDRLHEPSLAVSDEVT